MSPSTPEREKQFCEFIAELDLIQLSRFMDGPDLSIAAEISRHVALCTSQACARTFEEWIDKEDQETLKEWDALSEEEKHRRALTAEASLRQLRALGVF